MTDSFIEVMDTKYERKLHKAHLKTGSPKELKVLMIKGVEDSNLSERQKTHTIENIVNYELPKAVWDGSQYMKPAMIGKMTLDFLPEDYTRREEEAGRVRTTVRKGRFADTLAMFEVPTHRSFVSKFVADEFGLSPATISRDISPLFRAGFLTRISWGLYEMTDLGREVLSSL